MSRSRHTVSRLRPGLGTLVALEAESADPRACEEGVTAAFAAIATVEQLMHPERPGSDIAVLSCSAPGAVITVADWTWDVLSLCQHLHRVSAGTFDPCLSSSSGRMTDIELLKHRQVRVQARAKIDLGGVAKGYAVDRAIEAMRAAGCEAGLVNAGGDLAVFGAQSRTVFCRSASGSLRSLELHNAALASSDTENLDRPEEHRGYYHGTDRNTPIAGSVSVTAASAAVADALTKCLLAAGGASARALLHACGARQVV
jgi:thiamine biosynthesis lipoprotein